MEEVDGGATGGSWLDWYRFFPWEDARAGRPAILDREIEPLLRRWTAAAGGPGAHVFRARVAFRARTARRGTTRRCSSATSASTSSSMTTEAADAIARLGEPMDLDHRRILATAIGRLRGKIKYRPVVFELIGETFTLSELQSTVEALAGMRLHGPNFRRLVEESGIVERHRRAAPHLGAAGGDVTASGPTCWPSAPTQEFTSDND